MKQLFIIFLVLLSNVGWAQKKALSNVEIDSMSTVIYTSYEPQRELLSAKFEQADSATQVDIMTQWDANEDKCYAELLRFYGASAQQSPYAIEMLYRLRTSVDKNTLKEVFSKIKPKVRSANHYAQLVQKHLDTDQVTLGGQYADFTATTYAGEPFTLSELVSMKDVLLIFGGLGCMGEESLQLVKLFYAKVDISKLEVVSVFMNTSMDEFKAEHDQYGIGWLGVCDTLGDDSPAKNAYGIQATPTCVYINKGGQVSLITVGVTDQVLQKLEK